MKRASKHNARRHTATVGGQECHFDSMAEHRYAEHLERERKAGRIASWQHHPKPGVIVMVGERPAYEMEVDFVVCRRGGIRLEWHEVKGMATAAWRIKRKVMYLAMPHIAYVVIDAGRGVCATGEGEPALFDERPRRRRRAKAKK